MTEFTFFFVVVKADPIMTCVSQANTCNEANISGTNDTNAHKLNPLLNDWAGLEINC